MTDRERFTESLSRFLLKPAPDGASGGADDEPTSVAGIEAAARSADDKERLIGLLAAPVAALITILVTGDLVSNDPRARLASGAVNPLHVDPHRYLGVALICLVLAFCMLAAAWFRKRLVIGVAMALFGLSIFNLHFWGFGVPYVIGGAWYLVRSYRWQQRLKAARAGEVAGGGAPRSAAGPSKRYTPPGAIRGSRPKPG